MDIDLPYHIDTYGAISRISYLFRGHRELIVAFNIYLPPDFRIQNVLYNGEVQVSTPGINLGGDPQVFYITPSRHPGSKEINKMLTEDAYLDQVKSEFENQPEVYSDFIDIINKFKSQRIQEVLFNGEIQVSTPGINSGDGESSPQLITIIPRRLDRPPVSESKKMQGHQFQRPTLEDAFSFLDQVKYKFKNQPQVYNDFIFTMLELKNQRLDTNGCVEKVSNLFRGHPELIQDFNAFLPLGYRIKVELNEEVQVSTPGVNLKRVKRMLFP